jgi:hypothetical protein
MRAIVPAALAAALAAATHGAPAAAQAPAPVAVTGYEVLDPTVRAWAGEAAPERPALASALALPAATLEAPVLLARTARARGARAPQMLNPERARALLRSLTVPGWGQATLGHRRSAAVFAIAEAGVWGAFTSFRVQAALRRQSYERTARLFAGIDLDGRDEEFRRIVGSYLSSEEYNRLVIYRDAANLYYDQPDAYRQYIAEHSLGGADTWAWSSIDEILRYRAQRKDEQRASLRANTALAVAVANRIVSAIHAARQAGRATPATPATSWNVECVPVGGDDPTAFRLGVRARF